MPPEAAPRNSTAAQTAAPPAGPSAQANAPVANKTGFLGNVSGPPQRAYQSARDWTAARRTKLPVFLQRRIERLPAGAILGLGVGASCIALLLAATVLSRALSTEASPLSDLEPAPVAAMPASPTQPSQEPIVTPPSEANAPSVAPPSEANAPSVAPADDLDEASVLLGLANKLADKQRHVEAVALIDRLLRRQPALRVDTRLMSVLRRTVNAPDRAAASASFDLLEEAMAEQGAEILYELSIARDIQDPVRRRAQRWIGSKDFERAASLPLYTAVKLRHAKTCEDKRALLDLAQAGGKHTLEYLREIESRTTCSPDDMENCYPCFRADTRLSDAILNLQTRLGGMAQRARLVP